MTAADVPARQAARRFAEVVCPPEVRAGQRADRVLAEYALMLGVMPPAARMALAAVLVMLDQGARAVTRVPGRRARPRLIGFISPMVPPFP